MLASSSDVQQAGQRYSTSRGDEHGVHIDTAVKLKAPEKSTIKIPYNLYVLIAASAAPFACRSVSVACFAALLPSASQKQAQRKRVNYNK
jgi:hypothetical protein